MPLNTIIQKRGLEEAQNFPKVMHLAQLEPGVLESDTSAEWRRTLCPAPYPMPLHTG